MASLYQPARLPVRPGLEWLGTVEYYPTIRDEEQPVAIQRWIELPSRQLVGERELPPNDIGGFLESFIHAVWHPATGNPRAPECIVVNCAIRAIFLREAFGDQIDIEETPEALEQRERLELGLSAEQGCEDYLSEGRVSPTAIGELFRASADLYRMALWEKVSEERVFRLDLPDLGLQGAGLAITTESPLGFCLSYSVEDCKSLLTTPGAPSDEDDLKLAPPFLGLDFVPESELTETHLEQAREHGWTVAGPDAWPLPVRFGPDGQSEFLRPPDIEFLTQSTLAIVAFMSYNGTRILTQDTEPISQTFTIPNHKTVHVTYPA